MATKTKQTVIASTIGLLLLLSLTTGVGNKAFAMGDPPTTCGNTYQGTITGLTLTNGTTTIDVLKNPGTTLDVAPNKSYNATLVLQSGSIGTISNTTAGAVWISTNADAFQDGICESVPGPNSSATHTLQLFAATLTGSGIHQSASICANFLQPQCVGWTVFYEPANSSPQLTVNSQDISGNTISGYYTVLMQNGNTISNGFTPATFSLTANQPYTVEVQDYGQYVFDHWSGSGSTSRDNTFDVSGVSSNTQITAVYRNINTQPSGSNILVKSVDSANNPLPGYYTVLYQNNAIVNTGFTPAAFSTSSGQTYTAEVQDYGPYHFDHWSDNGSTNRDRVFTASSSGMTFTAVYSNTVSTTSGTATFNIATTDTSGNPIYGFYITISQPPTITNYGFSPVSFTVPGNQPYTLMADDYGSYHFDHWSTGDSTSSLAMSVSAGQTVNLVAVYRAQ